MHTTTCPKCGKKLNPQRSFDVYLGSNGTYYDYQLVTTQAGSRRVHGVYNAPKDITLKLVSVGYDCITAIRAEIAKAATTQVVTRKFYAPNH